MKHTWLYSDLLSALKGKLSQFRVLNRGALISASALLPLQRFFWSSPVYGGGGGGVVFCCCCFLLVFIPVSVLNMNRNKHTETLDITNMHVLGKNKQEEKKNSKISIYS